MGRKFSISLAEWMIKNLGDDAIEKYWSEKNEISPWEIGYGSHKVVWFKCQKTDHHDNYDIRPNSFTNGIRCPFCSSQRIHLQDSFATWVINQFGEDFLEKYWDFTMNKNLNPYNLAKYSSRKAYFKCQNKDYHSSYLIPISGFKQGMRCSYCSPSGGKIHYNDSLGSLYPEVIKLWSNKNKKSPFDYAPKSECIVYWKCQNHIHDNYERDIKNSNMYNFNCPKCSMERIESFLQEKVRLFLTEELNYKVNHENYCNLKCINPKTNYPLLYDNEVILNESNKLIIEVHGVQHYKITSWAKEIANKKGISSEEEFAYQQWKDKYKKDFTISKGYHYLEIPYWTDNDQKEWKTLIVNKLNAIKNN